MAYSREVVLLGDYYEAAAKMEADFGKTDRHQTGIKALDTYLGGGFGIKDGYEIVVVFGETGIGKSTLAMNLIAAEAVKGTSIGYMLLEDDVRHFVLRMKSVVGEKGMQRIDELGSIRLIPKVMLREMWKLDEILLWIREQAEQGVELFVMDHLQFIFENNADEARNEYHQQRKFMRDLNALLDELRVTVIIVSHTNKGTEKGLDRIIGSSGIAGAGSKVIGVYRPEKQPHLLEVIMHKSRHTILRDAPVYLRRKGYKLWHSVEDLS